MRDDLSLLEMMMRDERAQRDVYRAGPYWKNYCRRMLRALRHDGLSDFRSNPRIGKGFSDTVLSDPVDLWSMGSWKQRMVCHVLKNHFIREFVLRPYLHHIAKLNLGMQEYKNSYWNQNIGAWFAEFTQRHELPEMAVGNPTDVVKLRDTIVPNSYLSAFIRIASRKGAVDLSKVRVAFELGGGFGAMAHALIHLYPNIRKYIYLDIPPTLYIGTQYLRHFYPDNVISYNATRDLQEIFFSADDRLEIIALCPWQIERVSADVDVFWNSSSFQEMPVPVVDYYLDQVARLLRKDGNGFVCLDAYNNAEQSEALTAMKLMEVVSRKFMVRKVENCVSYSTDHCFVAELNGQYEGCGDR